MSAVPNGPSNDAFTPSVRYSARTGFILWFTGLSGAGKSTLAQAVRDRVQGTPGLQVLDGDEVRQFLTKDLGFSRQDRDENVHRIAWVARLLARVGVPVTTAAISPYAATRAEVRRLAAEDGIPFVEVFASAPLEVVAQRDVKGLYKRALAGEIPQFTGVSDPYEAPDDPDVVVHSDRETVEEGATRILRFLETQGLAAVVDDQGKGHQS